MTQNLCLVVRADSCLPVPSAVNATAKMSVTLPRAVELHCLPSSRFPDGSTVQIVECLIDGTWPKIDHCGRKYNVFFLTWIDLSCVTEVRGGYCHDDLLCDKLFITRNH